LGLAAAQFAVLPRREASGLAEHAREIGLRAETELERDFDQGQAVARELLPRSLDAAIGHVTVRRQSGRLAKQPGEMIGAETSLCRQILEPDVAGKRSL